ncbi:MAG: acyl-CoA dehydratase activase [Vicinamibacterales bacterium]
MDQSSLPLAGPGGPVSPECQGPASKARRPAIPPYTGIGIDVGSVSVKVCGLAGGAPRSAVIPHDGDIESALRKAFAELHLDPRAAAPAVVTGGAGRHRLEAPGVIAASAIEAALDALSLRPRAVVSLGGEDLLVYLVDPRGRVQTTVAGNKCASGTGEFFRQQLGRMDLRLEDLDEATAGARVLKLAARCSVFMKSDCTHRLNKGEATRGDVALSLSKVMADKVGEFLIRAKVRHGAVILIGGVTRNRHFLRFLEAAWPQTQFVVPEEATFFEAFGAAHLSGALGRPLPTRRQMVRPFQPAVLTPFAPLRSAESRVTYHPSRRGALRPDAEYVLGVDGGSTTTKVALVDAGTMEIAAAHYGRTHGDPVAALKRCLAEVQDQLGGVRPRVSLVATTGSSRELLGVFLETAGVYNEIVAHAAGTTFFDAGVDTLFEIGGQDAKYVLLNNGVPIEYAMNEACSAGTGSFLEESAAGDLRIERAEEIGPVALEAAAPLKFGEHCSAFINSDIRKAIQGGASRPDIVAGLVFSIVANYLNRVVGNRQVGTRIALQGGVAKNPAVPLAFAQLLGKPVSVPPDPELMGCFGVARLALQKHREGLVAKGAFDLCALAVKDMLCVGAFTCQACDNSCEIRNLAVDGRRYPFGGRCSKFTSARRPRPAGEGETVDHVAWRTEELFARSAPRPEDFRPRSDRTVGVPLALSVHSLWPLYARFFHDLGVRTVLSDRVLPEGIARQESSYCFPVEIAHGAIQDLVDKGVDHLFLPHFRDMPSMEAGTAHACTCPLTQGLPYLARQAFGVDANVLRPVVSFKRGWADCRPEFARVAAQLGFDAAEGGRAFDRAVEAYLAFLARCKRHGREVMEEIRDRPGHLFVGLFGRPYNAFTRDANMGIPRKFTSRGVSVVPFDLIYAEDAPIFPNMYWYYGQQDMKGLDRVRSVPNLYAAWISNFSCAPDSFMLHYLRWMMGRKPYLVLEIDSHTADAGLDTRIEAFLDIVESFRRDAPPVPAPRPARRYRVDNAVTPPAVVDTRSEERFSLRDPRVTFVWPSFGDLASPAFAAATRKQGAHAEYLPVPTARSTQLARNVASGKECIPALLVLGSVLEFIGSRTPRQPDEALVVAIPSTLGPCRTGQYHVFYERLFDELGLDNVALFVSGDDSSYGELGPGFVRDVWRAILLSDYFTDIRAGIRLCARDVDASLAVFERVWQGILAALERDSTALAAALKGAGEELRALPRRRSLTAVKKVLVVGEIYVRRDTFSVFELSEHLLAHDIFPKLSGISEWIYYTDWARAREMDAVRQQGGWLEMLRRGTLTERLGLGIEGWWKRRVERDIRRALAPTGLIPEAHDDLDAALAFGTRTFIPAAMQSEATVSPAVAGAAMQDGYSGVAIIAPFGCLPGRVIEGVYTPWARARGYPVLALENDGQPYPPNVIARLEVFAQNVERYTRTEAP